MISCSAHCGMVLSDKLSNIRSDRRPIVMDETEGKTRTEALRRIYRKICSGWQTPVDKHVGAAKTTDSGREITQYKPA